MQSSRWVRMAQPSAGEHTGISFPLIKDTEVIISCINGDVDRPIIVGAVHNPAKPAITTSANSQSNIIRTNSGITMSFNDGVENKESTAITSSGGAAQQQNNQNINKSDLINNREIKNDDINNNKKSIEVQHYSELEKQKQNEVIITNNKTIESQETYKNEGSNNFKINVPYMSSRKITGETEPTLRPGVSYLRMGGESSSEIIKYTGQDLNDGREAVIDTAGTGWVDYTSGNRTTVTEGKKTEIINGGPYKLIINKGSLSTEDAGPLHHLSFYDTGYGWRRTCVEHISSDTYSYGDVETFFAGFKMDAMVGMSTSLSWGGKVEFGFDQTISFKGDNSIKFGKENNYDWVEKEDHAFSSSSFTQAIEKIEMVVDKDANPTVDVKKELSNIKLWGAGLAAIGCGVTVSGGLSGKGTAPYVGLGHGASMAMAAVLTRIMKENIQNQKEEHLRPSQFVMQEDFIGMAIGDGKIIKNEIFMNENMVKIGTKLDVEKLKSEGDWDIKGDEAGCLFTMDDNKVEISSAKGAGEKGGEIILKSKKFEKQKIELRSTGGVHIQTKKNQKLHLSNGKHTINFNPDNLTITTKNAVINGKAVKIGKGGVLKVV
ncbi:phage baseplate assembly protein V [Marinicellulosiphila megalodicopiae]|uniref:phage baseplate assembly protein V n=1 Tax=Marinicellulosiphila megalodicopiae TaxID=2724896 RepID=UPI003BAE3B20